jgi:hypothetical protein
LDKEVILSRVQNCAESVIGQFKNHGPVFIDLRLHYNVYNAKYSVYCKKLSYDQEIHNEGQDFNIDEYEVFSVVRKRK